MPRYARRNVSWSTSSASSGLRTILRARLYTFDSYRETNSPKARSSSSFDFRTSSSSVTAGNRSSPSLDSAPVAQIPSNTRSTKAMAVAVQCQAPGRGPGAQLSVEDFPDLARERVRVEGLLQKVGTRIGAPVARQRLARVCGEEQGIQGGAVAHEPPRPGDAVAVRHDDVAQEKMDLPGERPVHLHRLGAVLGLQQAISQLFQNQAGDVPRQLVVLDEEHRLGPTRCFAGGSFFLCDCFVRMHLLLRSHSCDPSRRLRPAAAPGGARSRDASSSSAGFRGRSSAAAPPLYS